MFVSCSHIVDVAADLWDELPGSGVVANAQLGRAVALDEVAALGCWACNAAGEDLVFVYGPSGAPTDWNLLTTLTNDVVASGGDFGRAVATVGTTVVVSAPAMDRPNDGSGITATGCGALFTFHAAGGDPTSTWSGGMLPIPTTVTQDAQLGRSIALSRQILVAGAPGQEGLTPGQAGVVYAWAAVDPMDLTAGWNEAGVITVCTDCGAADAGWLCAYARVTCACGPGVTRGNAGERPW